MPPCVFHKDRPSLARGLCNACYRRARRDGTVTQHTYKRGVPRLWLDQFLADTPQTDNCIEWPYGRDKGYGVIVVDGKVQRVTRVVLAEKLGVDMTGAEACHTCDHPPCVNPRHLFSASHRVNMIDAAVKERMSKKLTARQVVAIRALKGLLLQREIGSLFGINQTVVGDIHRRTKWNHVA